MAEAVAPKPSGRAPLPKRQIKVFTVEFSSNFEGAIPHGWTPFGHVAMQTNGNPAALIYAYK